jgi:hypothetical protein
LQTVGVSNWDRRWMSAGTAGGIVNLANKS